MSKQKDGSPTPTLRQIAKAISEYVSKYEIKEIARKTNTNKSYLRRIVNGSCLSPSYPTIRDIHRELRKKGLI